MPLKADRSPYPDPQSVFLNVPYDAAYQPLFVTMVASLVCLGQLPRCVLEIGEMGQGRLRRIFDLLASCRTSVHDLSRVGLPPRFNMPFELGMSCALNLRDDRYQVAVCDAKPYRLDRNLSDYKGRDPLIHNNRCDDLVGCLLDTFVVPDEPSPRDLRESARFLRKSAREIAAQYRSDTVFRAAPYRALVEAARQHAVHRGYIPA